MPTLKINGKDIFLMKDIAISLVIYHVESWDKKEKEQFSWVLPAIETFAKEEKPSVLHVLEVGCADIYAVYLLTLLYCLKNNIDLNYTAIDINKAAISEYKKSLAHILPDLFFPTLAAINAADEKGLFAAMQEQEADIVLMSCPIVESPKGMPVFADYQELLALKAWYTNKSNSNLPNLTQSIAKRVFSMLEDSPEILYREIARLRVNIDALQPQYDSMQKFFQKVLYSVTSPTASFAAKVFHQEEVKALEDFFKQEASSFSAVQSDGEVVCARRKAKGAENTLQGGSNNQLGIFKPPAPAEVKQDAAPSSPSTVALGRKCG